MNDRLRAAILADYHAYNLQRVLHDLTTELDVDDGLWRLWEQSYELSHKLHKEVERYIAAGCPATAPSEDNRESPS